MAITTDGSLYTNDKLGMVNQCLLAIGEVPLSSGIALSALQPGTDGAVARDVVGATAVDIMSHGWFFNIDKEYRLYPDIDGFITVPPNVIRIDGGAYNARGRYLLRGARLYDRQEQTFKIPETFIAVDIIYAIDYSDMPQSAYTYISLRSARKFQEAVIGSESLYKYTVTAEREALANMQREHLQYSDINMLSNRVATAWTNPVWGND